LHAVNQLSHTFPATTHGVGGVTATILLAESHLCIHTWPELRGVTIDVYVCNIGGDNSHQAEDLMELLLQKFEPIEIQRHHIQRGNLRSFSEAAKVAIHRCRIPLFRPPCRTAPRSESERDPCRASAWCCR
jgi:S-adenosylmethionine decarboxylase